MSFYGLTSAGYPFKTRCRVSDERGKPLPRFRRAAGGTSGPGADTITPVFGSGEKGKNKQLNG